MSGRSGPDPLGWSASCGSRTDPTRVRGGAPVRPRPGESSLTPSKDVRMPAPTSSSNTVAASSGLAPLVVSGLSVTYPDRTVLSGIDLLAQPGRRIGLVGENGVGKSTLLRAVAGRLPARARVAGTVTAPDDLVLLGQEPP